MSQNWNFGTQDPDPYDLDQPPPTPQRFRKVLDREQRTHDQLRPEAQPEEAAEPPPGRDAHGRFTKGNKGGTGNPFARQTAALRKALVNAVTEEDMAEVAATVVAKAKAGDMAAAKLLFTYVLGKPTEMPNPDRLDLDDYQLLKERLSPLRADWDLIRDMTPVEGIVQAGHQVADLRAANWRAQVLPAAAPAAADAEPARPAHVLKEEADLRQEEIECGVAAILAMVQEERETRAARTQAESTGVSPSPNGANGSPTPSTPGSAPSANGRNGHPPAAQQAVLPRHTGKAEEDLIYARQARMLPSANGRHGHGAPSATLP